MSAKKQPVGQTKDAGFQVGARRTFDISLEDAWALVTSAEGLKIWLGDAPKERLAKGLEYELASGATGGVRVFKPDSHLRMAWQPGDWPRPSTIQVRVIPSGKEKTVIAFHQEHLPGREERAERKEYYNAALDRLGELIAAAD